MMESPSQAWSRCEPWIAAALAREPGETRSIADVRAEVEAGKAWFMPGPNAAAVLRVTKRAHVWLAGGSLAEIVNRLPETERWAVNQGCERLSLVGRKGWNRVLAPYGFEPQTMLVKDL